MKEILRSEGIVWKLSPQGELLGFKQHSWNDELYDIHDAVYQFWVGNPPGPNDEHHKLFVAVCSFAVAKGFLRPIHTYAIV